MDFDEIYRSLVPSKESILEAVDEYTLYCFYSGIDNITIGRTIPAPFRHDLIPSFSIFYTNYETICDYRWKDHATGETGDIFRLIQKLLPGNPTLAQVYSRINEDFGLGYRDSSLSQNSSGKIMLFNRPNRFDIKIRIADIPFTEKGISYWDQFKIGKDLLDFYKVSQIKWYWSYDTQEVPAVVENPTFAYRIGKHYSIYSPFAEKTLKFRNDFPRNYFYGYLQLPEKGEKLIIDKSGKDVIFCRRLGYYAVAGKSETTFIPADKMNELKDRFEQVYIMLDNDVAGRKKTEEYISLYPWLKPRFLPVHKDKTDNCLKEGFEATAHLVRQLLN